MPDFITRMLGLEAKLSAHLSNEEKIQAAQDRLALAEARVKTLEAELGAAKADSPDGAVAITTLTGERDTARAELAAKSAELAKAKTDAAAALVAATNKANEVLAAQGISLEILPVAGPSGNPAGSSPDVLTDLRRQLAQAKEPKEKFRLAQKLRELTNPAETT